MRHYLIIGSGAAGISAAEAIRGQDTTANLTLFGNEGHHYYSRPGLAYYLAGEVPRNQLFPYSPAYMRSLGITVRSDTVTRIDPEAHQIQLKNGQLVNFDRLLIATGATAVRPEVPGSDLKGVVKLDNMDDADLILSQARRGKTAVVVGGGITALEIVEGLMARELKVHYFLRGDRYWSNVLDEVESHIVEDRLKKEGVNIYYNTNLVEILGKGGRVAGVRGKTRDTTFDLRCDIAATAIGIRPRKELATSAGLKTERGILVNAYLGTSHPDIFAAGDVAQVYDSSTGEYTVDSLIAPAIEQGRSAGLNMAGITTLYKKEIPINVTRLAGMITTIIGMVGTEASAAGKGKTPGEQSYINRGDSETWRRHPDAVLAQTYFGENRLRLFMSADRLVGSVVMGDQKISLAVQYLIRCQVDISPLRPHLLEPDAPLVQLVIRFWEEQERAYAAKIA
jgi:NAD(P)H-nitrite reductase large subunit